MMNKKHFPALTLGLGGIGLVLRIWLYNNRDALGLLPTGHISGYLALALTALALFLIFLGARRISREQTVCPPAPIWSGSGKLFLAAGILYCAFGEYLSGQDILSHLLLPVGLAAGIALVVSAIRRFFGKQDAFLPYCLTTVYLVLHVISQCRTWGTEPQVSSYGFHLLSSIFLMLTGYHRTALTIKKGSDRRFLFFSQSAIFFCCMVLNTQTRLFHLAMLLWLILDSPQEA